jgi:hypothetical protein
VSAGLPKQMALHNPTLQMSKPPEPNYQLASSFPGDLTCD